MSKPQRDAPAFDFYPERWLVGTAAMTDAEQISYLRLLCHQWMSGDEGLPTDAPTLKRLAGKGCSTTVLAKFPVGSDGKRRNQRLEIIRSDQRERIAKKSEQRRAAVNKRWEQERLRQHNGDDTVVLRSYPPRNTGAIPTTHHPPPTTVSEEEQVGASGKSASVSAPSLLTVNQWASVAMVPPECAEIWWNDHEARGWSDKSGNLISNYRASFQSFATRWKANDHERRRNSHNGNGHKPKHQAYNREDATRGLTREQINNF